MKRIFLTILFACALFYVQANNGLRIKDSIGQGVQFDNSRWHEILKKAKKVKKFIFVDCYTTWCGPCERMDNEVYTKPEVGSYLNSHFISVKIQMDKTPTDDINTRNKYTDAEQLQKQQGIPAYPTYFIFSPDGKLLSRGSGLKFPEDFLGFVSSAIDPLATHPYARYYSMLSEYQRGKKDFKMMPDLIDTAMQIGQRDMADSLSKEYSAFLKTLPDQELYNHNIIGYLAVRVQSSDSRYFHLFHPNEQRINTLMGKNGYAQIVVGRIITNEYIIPVIPPIAEPDWNGIMKTITKKYDSSYAEENILKARIKWYDEHHDQANRFKYFTLLIKKYGANMEANNGDECANFMDCDLNSQCWALFKYSVDKEQIDMAIQCMKEVLERYRHRDSGDVPEGFIDTYANLLYKAGRTDESIQQEEGIVKYLEQSKRPAGDIKVFQDIVDKMKEGKPTWPHYIDKDDFFGMGLM